MTFHLPTAPFEGLLQKLSVVLELTQRAEGAATPQAKQALLQATNDFKNALSQAKELASALPGGELLVEDQTGVIDLLEHLIQHKRQQLSLFSAHIFSSSDSNVKMEIDSTASTPYAGSS